MELKRSGGVLMHISSLPSPYGIGTFGKAAYEFADFLKKSGQTYWQILPLGQTSYGDSPYQSFSSVAGNPYFIDLDELAKEGLLRKADYENENFGTDAEYVDYSTIFKIRYKILDLAYQNAKSSAELTQQMAEFYKAQQHWLDEYALYMAIKEKMNLLSWQEWDEDIKMRKPKALAHYETELADRIGFWKFLQFCFFKQWYALKDYANSLGIQIIGDIPIYVAADSVEAWANPELFKFDKNRKPTVLAGCPPDVFTEGGQRWGNPIYNWDYHKKTGYKWWINRIKNNLTMFDVIRIDHFRGFEAYWEFPAADKTAANGKWVDGPKMELFYKIEEELGELNIIAEDLGHITPGLDAFLEEAGYPGMKVLQFAFYPKEPSSFLPYFYDKNCIVYTGTHDNDTLRGWIDTTGSPEDVKHCMKYLNVTDIDNLHWDIIRCAWASVSNLAIVQMQDLLGLGNEARMNLPSTLGGNWQWRVKAEDLSDELAKKLKDLTKLYGRDQGNPDVFSVQIVRRPIATVKKLAYKFDTKNMKHAKDFQ
ncbi:MAG: 4-alpha-glucanotransferase [Epulopiscium sp. Nuni2H_MBin001]|nr:MAG: 4-alpha-glucanotransferase [Epulopiscium sp. Nuni2H_MBin001]